MRNQYKLTIDFDKKSEAKNPPHFFFFFIINQKIKKIKIKKSRDNKKKRFKQISRQI